MRGIVEEGRERGALDWDIDCIEGWGNEDMGMGIKSRGGGAVLCFVNTLG